jgi:hypothetical protein
MAEVPVIVVVKDEADFGKVQAACALRGLKDISALPRLRMLKGLIDPTRIDDLAKAAGVRSVEKEREMKLPPRGSPVQ